MTSYFSLEEAADRYDKYRPKVHNVVKDWLAEAGLKTPFSHAIDIACGTGDSTMPLLDISKKVIGIDQSKSMLAKAREKGLAVKCLGYEDAHTEGKFDLISTCMAFHWFDFSTALEAFRKASCDEAIWLIYNFSFGGSKDSSPFNDWFMNQYLKQYPSPPRSSHKSNGDSFNSLPDVHRLTGGTGTLPIQFTKTELIQYLTTQSNIEAKVKNGESYQDIEKNLQQQLDAFELNSEFLYNVTYDIYRFKRL